MMRVVAPLFLMFSFGCAHQASSTAPVCPPAPQCPSVDPARMEDLVQVDRENQEQLSKVDELTNRVARLQAAMSASLKGGATPLTEGQATVVTTGNKVRVRLSNELVFASASARITSGGRSALTQVATVIKQTPSRRIEIAGHTDSQPIAKKYQDNLELSAERAHRVAQYLVSQGVEAKHLVLVGYGESEPIETANSDEARAKNRRVEIFVEPLGGASESP